MPLRMRLLPFAILITLVPPSPAAAATGPITWGATVTLEGERPASWARMVRLTSGEWLAAYAVFGDPAGSVIRLKRSADAMR